MPKKFDLFTGPFFAGRYMQASLIPSLWGGGTFGTRLRHGIKNFHGFKLFAHPSFNLHMKLHLLVCGIDREINMRLFRQLTAHMYGTTAFLWNSCRVSIIN